MSWPYRAERRLADGRELIYFDDGPGRTHPASDQRPLPPHEAGSELRHDALVDEWVIVAAHRQERTYLPAAAECPLCPSAPDQLSEIPDADFDVAVFENRFPSLDLRAAPVPGAAEWIGPAEVRPGYGRCEVVVFTPDHGASFATLPPQRRRTIAAAWVDRSAALGATPGIAAVMCFENRGEEIGVTLHHPHGQVYAYPFVPPRLRRMVAAAERHRAREGGCLACAILAAELADRRRVVARTASAVAFVPAAARWPYEVHVAPLDHGPDLPSLPPATLDELVELQADVLRRFDRLWDRPAPYVAAWIQGPVGAAPELLHVHLEISTIRRDADKLKHPAGSETAMGAFINDIPPELAAERLRDLG